MKARDVLKNLISESGQSTGGAPAAPQAHKPSGAVRAMNLSMERLSGEAAAAKELRQVLAAGDKVVELDPALIDTAFIQDRIEVQNDPEFDRLVLSISESGQQVPILVRPHPSRPGRYQAAYGHRRLRVAAMTGRPVRAVVKVLSDEEVVLAQGQENGPRIDLSFIEKALFAQRLDTHGFDRDTIAKALSVDKPETSRLLQVAEGVGQDLILAIGPAPKVGRPRWLAIVERLKNATAAQRAQSEIRSLEFLQADSNTRFERLWKSVQEPAPTKPNRKEPIRTKDGRVLGAFEHGSRASKLAVTSKEFAAFLSDRMPDLVTAFEKEIDAKADT
ncbi:plasmid partitioning protein RepB [Rhizobium rhizosphaerae]|uniref:Plasmid partitioning protein RepB n=1 Tax=Xaviernesmea rhizosphaerae TaxID=1672749 RepID=A0A1Q9AHB9_9HYPH|nr:plasmid partitioning protein RepB [Xaviernesmea rhizosphaerae]OLP54640.1 plasmid partitioning protein RepB [Xaviernesmea rhizosphaerae]